MLFYPETSEYLLTRPHSMFLARGTFSNSFRPLDLLIYGFCSLFRIAGSVTSDTCRFWVETSGLTRGDVSIPEGKVYFAVPCWGGKLSRKGLITVRQRR